MTGECGGPQMSCYHSYSSSLDLVSCPSRSDCLTTDQEMPKPKFVKEVLEKCMRYFPNLSFHNVYI